MPNKRKICTENLNSNQSIYIPSLNSYYPPENVINSAYRKVLDFKENAEKILEKEKLETLCLDEFSKAILDSRSFEISLQHNCIKLKCYITLEKDKDAKKKRNEQLQQQMQAQQQQHHGAAGMSTPPDTPLASNSQSSQQLSAMTDSLYDSLGSPMSIYGGGSAGSGANPGNSGGAKKVNVEVIMKSNPFRVEENEKTTRMELIRNTNNDNSMLRFTYYVRPECEAKKFRESSSEIFEKGRLVVFTNDFFTVYQDSTTGEMNISLNEIVQTAEEQKRTEALGEKLFILLKDRPRHRALLTNECKLNHSLSAQYMMDMKQQQQQQNAFNDLTSLYSNCGQMASSYTLSPASSLTSQEDETYYTRELIHIYGQPIVPSFHKHFNYQLSNTHYGYRTLRRLLNCDILKKYVKITKEEIKSLDRVVEFVQLTNEKCLAAFQLNITSFYDPARFENGIVKNWLDVWYVDRLKEKYAHNESTLNKDFICSATPSSPPYSQSLSPVSSLAGSSQIYSSSWSPMMPPVMSTSPNSCFLQASQCDHEESECDQANHLWFCLKDYMCVKMEEFMHKLKDYIAIRNNKSELILVHTAHPVFEYKDVLSEARRILAIFLSKSLTGKTLDELISKKLPAVAREHVENLLNKFLNVDSEKKIVGFTALFEILLVLKRELNKEKNDEMKYSHFLCTLERTNQDKLKMAIMQLKCVPCLNKFTTNFNLISSNSTGSLMNGGNCTNSSSLNSKNMVSHANMSRLLKQMSLIVSTELQQIAIDLIERMDEDKPVKYIKLKEEFKYYGVTGSNSMSQSTAQHMSCSMHSPLSYGKASSIPIPGKSNGKLMATSSSSSSLSNPTSTLTASASATAAIASLLHKHQQMNSVMQMKNLAANFKTLDLSTQQQQQQSGSTSSSSLGGGMPSSSSAGRLNLFNPHSNLQQFLSEQKAQDFAAFSASIDRSCSVANSSSLMYSDRI